MVAWLKMPPGRRVQYQIAWVHCKVPPTWQKTDAFLNLASTSLLRHREEGA